MSYYLPVLYPEYLHRKARVSESQTNGFQTHVTMLQCNTSLLRSLRWLCQEAFAYLHFFALTENGPKVSTVSKITHMLLCCIIYQAQAPHNCMQPGANEYTGHIYYCCTEEWNSVLSFPVGLTFSLLAQHSCRTWSLSHQVINLRNGRDDNIDLMGWSWFYRAQEKQLLHSLQLDQHLNWKDWYQKYH